MTSHQADISLSAPASLLGKPDQLLLPPSSNILQLSEVSRPVFLRNGDGDLERNLVQGPDAAETQNCAKGYSQEGLFEFFQDG